MANTKSAKKASKRSEKNRVKNLTRRTAIKTAVKKVLVAIEKGESVETTQTLLSDVAARLARAKNKNVMHQNTVSRKLSRLAKKVAHATHAAAK